MPTAVEVEAHEKFERAKPKASLLHHIAGTQAMETGFIVTLIDGTAYKADRGDFVFTDGLSIMAGGYRRYFPLTAIREIVISNPGER